MAEKNDQITPESVRELIAGSFPGDLSIEPLEITEALCRARLAVDERHLHPGKYVHGGVWTALGDTAAAWATFRNMPRDWNFTTIELKLNVFAAGRLGDEIIAEARPLHVGRSTAVIEVRMLRGEQLVANLIVSQFLLAPRDGAG